MKKKWLLVCLLLLAFMHSKAQELQSLVEECVSLLKSGNINAFDEKYPEIYSQYIKEIHPSYQEALINTQNGDYAAAIANLADLIKEGYFIEEITNDTNFTLLHNEKAWQELTTTTDSILSLQNLEVAHELKEIQNRDQSIRLFLLEVEKRKDDGLVKQVRNIMKDVDKESAAKVCAIIDRYGWLGPDKAGSEGNLTLFLAIQHVDDLVVQDKYLPILKKAVENGNADGWQLAFLTDRILMNQGEKQVYGTQKIIDRSTNDWYIVPLQNPDAIDELRKEIGLPPLAEDLEEEGFEWNLEEYKKDIPRIEKLYQQRFENMNKNIDDQQ